MIISFKFLLRLYDTYWGFVKKQKTRAYCVIVEFHDHSTYVYKSVELKLWHLPDFIKWQLNKIWIIVLNTKYYIIPKFYFLQQSPDIIYGISRKSQISKIRIKLYHVKILMPESSSGDLYWVENQYFMVNMFWKRSKNEYSQHNVSILWALKTISAKNHEPSPWFCVQII